MKKHWLGCLSLCWISSAISAPIYNWTGFYLGANAGSDSAHFNTKTSTQPGFFFRPAEADTINRVGNQKVNDTGFLTGIQGGYNWQFNRLLLGLETDIQSLSINGDTNSGAVPNPIIHDRQYVITSYGNNNFLLTARPRIGVIANNWLFYTTGGLAVTLLQSDFIFSNNVGDLESQRVRQMKPGYVIGAGIETGITKNISIKAEYLFEKFNNTTASNMNYNIPIAQRFSNSVKLQSNILRVGVNYHFNDQATDLHLIPELFDISQWETEVGVRLFLSSGIDGAPQPLLNYSPIGNILASRLTFSELTAISEETFARFDHSSGLFAKGYLGAGSVTDGQLNDEDFPAGGAYSNTLSDISGNLSYATVDIGYSFLKTSFGKTGAFIGYNYYAQNLNAYSCKQLAGSEVCVPSSELTNFLGISEDDRFNSLRVGLTSQFNLSNLITLTSEVAYLPIVSFKGTDNHNARQLILPEQSSHGDGAMLESILDYQFANSWNVGLGGRYWLWNMHSGSTFFNFLGQDETFKEPARFHTERYGVFMQLSYHDRKPNNVEVWATPLNWKGIFVGGQMGGAWGRSNWSDPFVSTMNADGLVNIQGFGDDIRSTGPLGGANLNFNWQTNNFVYGVGVSIDAADIRGDNTLFSGIGGVNGETVTNYLATIVARGGTTINRTLLYINAGRALLNTSYRINANTNALTLGTDSDTINAWGWTGGVGIEQALTDHWSSYVEYDYIRIPAHVISLSSIELINDQRITANQTMNVFKVGVNYKFDV